jgi:hypothetical protein
VNHSPRELSALRVQSVPPHLWTRLGTRLGRNLSSFPTLLAAILIARVYWSCRDNIADPDLWWHLRNAQYFFAHLRFPNVDSCSFTAAGTPWIDHEWLPEVFFYAAFQNFGLTGIFVLFTSLLAILLIAVFSLTLKESKDPFAAAIATLLGGLLAMVGFAPRAQNFGWLCFIGIYAILLRFRRTKDGPVWLIPILFCVWINCHGSWPMGFVIYGVIVGAALVRRDFGRLAAAPWSRAELKKLISVGIVSLVALFVNPFGYRLLLYPFDTAFRQKFGVGYVEEWASINFNDPRGQLVALVLGCVFVLGLMARRRWRIDDALLTLLVLYFVVTHIRFLLLAGLVLPPILAPQFGRLSSYDPRRERRLLNAMLLIIVVAVCALGFPSRQMLESEVASFFPKRAVQFLRQRPQQGRMLNLYQWGGYLEWNLPSVQTFLDSRSDIFDHKGILKDYLSITALNNSEELLDRYRISYVLFPADTPLSYFLSKSQFWQPIYRDPQAVIYRRRSDDVGSAPANRRETFPGP